MFLDDVLDVLDVLRSCDYPQFLQILCRVLIYYSMVKNWFMV